MTPNIDKDCTKVAPEGKFKAMKTENALIGWSDEDIKLAKDLHSYYEMYAQEENWKTQELTKTNIFTNLPVENQRVMLRLANRINTTTLFNKKESEKRCLIQKKQATYSINYSTDIYDEFMQLVKVIDTFNTEVKK